MVQGFRQTRNNHTNAVMAHYYYNLALLDFGLYISLLYIRVEEQIGKSTPHGVC